MHTDGLEIRRLTGTLGAEIRGLDLRQPLSDAQLSVLLDALHAHRVVFLRKQPLDDDQHLAFARRLGSLSVYPVLELLGMDQPIEFIEDNEHSPPKADGWHTDITWVSNPPVYGILSARVIPEYGGDTIWADLRAAYEALSPTLQRLLEGLVVSHRVDETFFEKVGQALGEEKSRMVREKLEGGADHPLVIEHPVTGDKVLYAAGYWMKEIRGMTAEESEMLLGFLMDHVDSPRFQVRWNWDVDDLAIWDERCTVHRALADHYPQQRVMRRCTVDADTPPRAPSESRHSDV